MLSEADVLFAFRLILGRDPVSRDEYEAHQAHASLRDLGHRLQSSPEFQRRASAQLEQAVEPRWVCAEIRNGLRIWVDLSDIGVSAGCLVDDWEPAETDFILSVLQPGDVFVDVGANIGWFTILAAHAVGPEGFVHAFEPRPDRVLRLRQSIRENGFDDRCEVTPIALGATDAELDLAWMPAERNPGHSFLLSEPLPDSAERLTKVPVRPLDSLGIDRPVRILKIDVEGAEPQVLQGARELLVRDKPILVLEVFPQWIEKVSKSSAAALMDGLRGMGYRIFRLAAQGLGRELRHGDTGIEPGGAEYFGVVALSQADARSLLAQRLDHRVADLERRLVHEHLARHAADARLEELLQAPAAKSDPATEAALSQARELAAAAEARAEEAEARAAEALANFGSAEARLAAAVAAAGAAEARAGEAAKRAAQAEARVIDAASRATAAELRAEQAEAASAASAATIAQHEATLQSARRAATAATAEARRAQEAHAAAAQRLHGIEASTAWAMTMPLRRLAGQMPNGARRTLRRGAKLIWWTVSMQVVQRIKPHLVRTPPASLSAPAPAIQDSALPATPERAAAVQPLRPPTPLVAPCLPAKLRPRVLIIDSRWPSPDRDSGSLDAVLQIRTLRRLGYEVVLAADAEYTEVSPRRESLEAEGVICLSPARTPSIDAFLESDGATLDLCFMSRIYCGGRYYEALRRHAPRARLVFNTVDLHHLRELREARLNDDSVALRRAEATRERELYLVRQADATIVVSAAERDLLQEAVPGAEVFEMPLARPVRDPTAIPGFAARSGIGFIGAFDHRPNVDAVDYLVRKIWPLVLQRLPSAQLAIVGAGLPDEALADAPAGISYLGPLPEIDSWLDGLRLTVAPLRYGAGAKGKVASSLAAGVPCVATPVAAEGMRLRDGVEVAIGETPAQLAEQICRLHEDAVLWQRLSQGGHDKARRELSPQDGEARLAKMLATLDQPIPHDVSRR
jgi:FkbM family methyltransferase